MSMGSLRRDDGDYAAEQTFYPPTWLDYNNLRQIVVSPAAAGPGQAKYASSQPMGTRYKLVSAIVITDKPSATAYVRVGYSPGAVTDEPSRLSGFNLTMGTGSDPNGKPDAIRMLASAVYLGPYEIYVSDQSTSLYVMTDNGSGGIDTVNVTVIFLVELNPTSVPPQQFQPNFTPQTRPVGPGPLQPRGQTSVNLLSGEGPSPP